MNVLTKVELLPNKVLTVVALRFICVPTTVDETFVPIVVVELAFAEVAAAVFIPVPSNVLNNLTSAIVAL